MNMDSDGAAGVLNSPLGRAVSYRADYAPELLFPIARSDKRSEIGLRDEALPFFGEDIWNAYEISWLNPRGKPVVAIGEFRVPAASPRLIESKSLKLYLNSFNQSSFADMARVRSLIAQDLSAAAGAAVAVSLRAVSDCPAREQAPPAGVLLDDLDIDVSHYQQPDVALLAVDAQRQVDDELLYSHLLKSNCLVTGQPDWAMLCIRYSGAALDRAALLAYIIAYRQHNEFHEQCVERVYCDLMQAARPSRLAVWARYTRRGGLDINPARASDAAWLPGNVFEARQ